MKRKLMTYLLALMMLFTISSCEVYSYATTQDDIYVESEVDVVHSNVSFDVIIRYGTPYYRNGALLYYFYNDIYYYPFYYNNYWYVRAYRRPFIHLDRRPYFRPHRYDYRFSPGYYRGYGRPRNYIYEKRNFDRRHIENRSYRRPNIRQRVDPHQRNNNHRGHFGGRR